MFYEQFIEKIKIIFFRSKFFLGIYLTFYGALEYSVKHKNFKLHRMLCVNFM